MAVRLAREEEGELRGCVAPVEPEVVGIAEAAAIANMCEQSMRNVLADPGEDLRAFPVKGCNGKQVRLRDLRAWLDRQQAADPRCGAEDQRAISRLITGAMRATKGRGR